MEQYELTIIAPEELTVVDKIKLEKLIKRYGRLTKRIVEGVKNLCYAINGREKGLYLYYELEMETPKPSELSEVLGRQDNAIRYLLVQADNRSNGSAR